VLERERLRSKGYRDGDVDSQGIGPGQLFLSFGVHVLMFGDTRALL
jgi:hypothetical protein